MMERFNVDLIMAGVLTGNIASQAAQMATDLALAQTDRTATYADAVRGRIAETRRLLVRIETDLDAAFPAKTEAEAV